MFYRAYRAHKVYRACRVSGFGFEFNQVVMFSKSILHFGAASVET